MRELKLAFYTCFYGGDDNVAFVIPEIPSLKYDCFYYTNNKKILAAIENTKWIGIYDDKQIGSSIIEASYVSKHIKIKPSNYKELKLYDYLCYLDSKLEKLNEEFIEKSIVKYFIDQNYALLLREHWNNGGNVWQEAYESMFQDRYYEGIKNIFNYIHHQIIDKGLSAITDKHCATGLLIKNMKHEKTIEIENTWYQHVQACGIQCQISFFFVKQLFTNHIHPFSVLPSQIFISPNYYNPQVGDQVKIVEKWLNSPAEAKLTFTVLEIIDNRVDIQVNGSTLRFVPIERVDLNHIEQI